MGKEAQMTQIESPLIRHRFHDELNTEQIISDSPLMRPKRSYVEEVPIEDDEPVVRELVSIIGSLVCRIESAGDRADSEDNVVSLLFDHGQLAFGELVGLLPGKASVVGEVVRLLREGRVILEEAGSSGVPEFSLETCQNT
jgi:hypothetical protein